MPRSTEVTPVHQYCCGKCGYNLYQVDAYIMCMYYGGAEFPGCPNAGIKYHPPVEPKITVHEIDEFLDAARDAVNNPDPVWYKWPDGESGEYPPDETDVIIYSRGGIQGTIHSWEEYKVGRISKQRGTYGPSHAKAWSHINRQGLDTLLEPV